MLHKHETSIKETKIAPFHACTGNMSLKSVFPCTKMLHFDFFILTMQASDIKQRKKVNTHVVFNQLETSKLSFFLIER